jgi:hypothetical protein
MGLPLEQKLIHENFPEIADLLGVIFADGFDVLTGGFDRLDGLIATIFTQIDAPVLLGRKALFQGADQNAGQQAVQDNSVEGVANHGREKIDHASTIQFGQFLPDLVEVIEHGAMQWRSNNFDCQN